MMKKNCCESGREFAMGQVEGNQADEDLALLTKALGHPVRVQILRMLGKQQTCICGDIVSQLPLAQSTVSQHLKVLKDSGLIRGDLEGTSTCYCLNANGLKRLKILVAAL